MHASVPTVVNTDGTHATLPEPPPDVSLSSLVIPPPSDFVSDDIFVPPPPLPAPINQTNNNNIQQPNYIFINNINEFSGLPAAIRTSNYVRPDRIFDNTGMEITFSKSESQGNETESPPPPPLPKTAPPHLPEVPPIAVSKYFNLLSAIPTPPVTTESRPKPPPKPIPAINTHAGVSNENKRNVFTNAFSQKVIILGSFNFFLPFNFKLLSI